MGARHGQECHEAIHEGGHINSTDASIAIVHLATTGTGFRNPGENSPNCARIASLNLVGMARRAVRAAVSGAIGTFRPAAAGRGHRGAMSLPESGSWAGRTSTFWTRIEAMNLRFEWEGIALSMPTLKRGRRLWPCLGTDEAVPSKATGSWRCR